MNPVNTHPDLPPPARTKNASRAACPQAIPCRRSPQGITTALALAFMLALPHLAPPAASAQTSGTWALNASGSWGTSANWTSGTPPPDGIDAHAVFDNTLFASPAASRTITLPALGVTLGNLLVAGMNGTTTTTFAGTGTLTFHSTDPAGAMFAVQDQNNVNFNSAINLASKLSLTVNLGAASGFANALNISGAISGNGHALDIIAGNPAATITLSGAISGAGTRVTKSGAGALVLSGSAANSTFDGGLDVNVGSASATIAGAGNGVVLGAVQAGANHLGAGNVSVANNGSLIEVRSAAANQFVELRSGTLSLLADLIGAPEFRLTEAAAAHNGLVFKMTGGEFSGLGSTGTGAGTLRLTGADFNYSAGAITGAPSLMLDTGTTGNAASNAANNITVTLNGAAMDGRLGTVSKLGNNNLTFADSGIFRAADFVIESASGTLSLGGATLDITNGLTYGGTNAAAWANLLAVPAAQTVFGADDQILGGVNVRDGVISNLMLKGHDQSFADITLGAGARLGLWFERDNTAATPVALTLGNLTSAVATPSVNSLGQNYLSIYNWTGNPSAHLLDGTLAANGNTVRSTGGADLSKIWFRGYAPGATLDGSGNLIPVDFLTTTFAGSGSSTAGAYDARIYYWFDFANWSVDIPDGAGSTLIIPASSGSSGINLQNQAVSIGHVQTSAVTTYYLSSMVLTGGTVIFDSGLMAGGTKVPATISGEGGLNISGAVVLDQDLIVSATGMVYANSELYSGLFLTGSMAGAGNIYATGNMAVGGSAGYSPGFTGTIHAHQKFVLAATNYPLPDRRYYWGGALVLHQGAELGLGYYYNVGLDTRLIIEGDFTMSGVYLNYDGDVELTADRTITLLNTVGNTTYVAYKGFGPDLNLTGTGGLTLNVANVAAPYVMDGDGNTFSGGFTKSGAGALATNLRGDLVTGTLAPGNNYLGSGDIALDAGSLVVNGGTDTQYASAFTGVFTGSHNTTLTLNHTPATITDSAQWTIGAAANQYLNLNFNRDLTVNTPFLIGGVNLNANPESGVTHTISSTMAGGITNINVLAKSGAGTTILDTVANMGALTVTNGIFAINGDNYIRPRSGVAQPSLTMGGGLLQTNTGTNRFNNLAVTGNTGFMLLEHSALLFAGVNTWSNTAFQLSLANDSGNWTTAATLGTVDAYDTYVYFTSTTPFGGANAWRLDKVAFTGYEQGSELVHTIVGGTNLWFLAPTGASLSEWVGAISNPTDTDRLWSSATNWVGGVPNAAGRITAIRDIDGMLNDNVIIVDMDATVGKLLLESSGGQIFTIGGTTGGSLTFDNNGSDAVLVNQGAHTSAISADLKLESGLSIQTRTAGALVLSGNITGNGAIYNDSPYAGGYGTQGSIYLTTTNASGSSTSDYAGGFWLRGSTNTNGLAPGLSGTGGRQVRIGANGSLFGSGSLFGDGSDASLNIQALNIGDGTAGRWYSIRPVEDNATHVVDASIRFAGNLNFATGKNSASSMNLTFRSAAPSYVASGTWTLAGYSSYVYTSLTLDTDIQGPGALQLQTSFGETNVNFDGDNTFAGGVISHNGNIGVGSDTALGAGAVVIMGPTKFNARGGARVISNPFVFNSTDTTIWNTNDFTLNHSGSSALLQTANMSVAGVTVTVSAGHVLTGTGGLTKINTGELRLEGANEYTGNTQIDNGTLAIGNALSLGSTGTLIFNNNNYAGGLASHGGPITFGNDVVFSGTTVGLNAGAGLLKLTGTAPVNLIGNTGLTITGNVEFGDQFKLTGTGGINKRGAGLLTIINGNSDYSGDTTITGGTLRVNAAGNITLGAAAAGENYLGAGDVTFAAGATRLLELVTGGTAVRIGGNLNLTGNNAANTASINVTDTAGVVSGAHIVTHLDAAGAQTITGNAFGHLRTPGDLVKTGTNTLTWSGANIVTRNFNVNAGTLNWNAGATGQLTAASLNLGAGATINLGATTVQNNIQRITLGAAGGGTGDATLNLAGYNLTATNATLALAGDAAVDFGPAGAGLLTFKNLDPAAWAGALDILNWGGNASTGNGAAQFRFIENMTTALTSEQLATTRFYSSLAGVTYAQGARIARNAAGYYELLPLGLSAEWLGGGVSGNWSVPSNWAGDAPPNSAGSYATFGNMDPALDGVTVIVDTQLVLGGMVFSNTNTAAFSIDGPLITLDGSGADSNLNMTGNGSVDIKAQELRLVNGLEVNQSGSGTMTISGVITGTGAVTKTGSGALRLTGENTFAGGYAALEGLTAIDNNAALGAGTLTLGRAGSPNPPSGTLRLDANNLNLSQNILAAGGVIDTQTNSGTLSGVISGSHGLAKAGSGTLTLTSSNSYTGTTSVTTGALVATDAGALGASVLDAASGATAVLDFTGTLGNALTGSGSATITADSDITLTGANTIAAWDIRGAAAITAAENIGAGALALTGTLTAGGADNIVLANALTGNGALNFTNTGTHGLGAGAGAAFTGAVTTSAGEFDWDANASNALANATLNLTGGLLDIASGSQSANALILNGGTGRFTGTAHVNNLAVTGSTGMIFDPGMMTTAALLRQDEGDTDTMLVYNTHTGNLDDLYLVTETGARVGASSTLAIGTGTEALGVYSNTFANTGNTVAVAYQLNELILQAGKTLTLKDDTVAPPSGGNELHALISGSGNLRIEATNDITLNRQETHTGTTTIAAGMLISGTTDIIASSAALVNNAAFALNGHDQRVNNLSGTGTTLLENRTLTVNSNAGTTYAGAITGAGGVTKTGEATLTLSGSNNFTGVLTIRDGGLAITGTVASGRGQISPSGTASATVSGEWRITHDLGVAHGGMGALAITQGGVVSNSNAYIGNQLDSNGGASVDGLWQSTDRLAVGYNGTGTLRIGATGTVSNRNGYIGQYNGSGAATVAGLWRNTGNLRVGGNSDGALSIAGSGSVTAGDTYSQNARSTLALDATTRGANDAFITAASATLGGTLGVSGFTPGSGFATASAVQSGTKQLLIHTTNGIDGEFATATLAGFDPASLPDYLYGGAYKTNDGKDYVAGVNLAWFGGTAHGSGTFTIASGGTFNVDIALSDTLAAAANNWDGKSLAKLGGGLLILSESNAHTGTTTIAGGTLRLADLGGLGSGNALNNAVLELAATGTFANNIAGSGTTAVAANAAVAITGSNNTGWRVAGTAAAAQTHNLGAGELNLDGGELTLTNTAWTLVNALTGDGALIARLNGGTLALAQSAAHATAFTGTIDMRDGHFRLDAASADAAAGIMREATLVLGASGSTLITAGTHHLGGLTLAGGALKVNMKDATRPEGTLTVGDLGAPAGGKLLLDNWDKVSGTMPGGTDFFWHDSGTLLQQIVRATGAVENAGAQLDIYDFDGALITDASLKQIHENGGVSGTATYDYGALVTDSGANRGIYLAYMLRELAANTGTAITLDNAGTQDATSTLNARLTGAGGFHITGTGLYRIGNHASDYTGATAIATGTLQMLTDNALGHTSHLTLAPLATLDLDGHTQTTGALATAGGGTLDLNNGALTISGTTGASTSDGTLTGAGALTVQGGTLTVNGANTTLTAAITINTPATVIATDADALGAGTVTADGLLALAAATGTNRNAIAGAGLVSATNAANITLAGANTAYTGTWSTASDSALKTTAAASLGSGAIANTGTLTLGGNENYALNTANRINGPGALIKEDANTVAIAHANTGFTGNTLVNTGTLALAAENAIGAGAANNNAALALAFEGAFANTLAGTGTTIVAPAATIAITGTNTAFTGAWHIAGTATMTAQHNLGVGGDTRVAIAQGGALALVNMGGDHEFNHALTGAGTLLAANTGTFGFGAATGAAFTGTVRLQNNTFTLADNTLANATLNISENNRTTVAAGVQRTGDLALSAGTIAFALDATGTAAAGVIHTGHLSLTGSTVVVVDTGSFGHLLPLLQQDEGRDIELIVAEAHSGVAQVTGANLLHHDGSIMTAATQRDIIRAGVATASGTYDFAATVSGSGLRLGYELTALELLAGQTTLLDNDTAFITGGGELHALLSGSGNLQVSATGAITLNNPANTHTGATRVTTGTLVAGNNGALGATSLLSISADAAADLNHTAQTIGTLQNAGALLINGGTLTIQNGGASDGILDGTGALALTGGTLSIATANPTLAASTHIAPGAVADLKHAASLGSGAITADGTLRLDTAPANSGTLANALSGSGVLIKSNSGTVAITRPNPAYAGTARVEGGALRLENPAALAAAHIGVAAGATLEYAGVAGALANTVNGAGTLAITNSGSFAIAHDNTIENTTLANATVYLGATRALGPDTATVRAGNRSSIYFDTDAARLGHVTLDGATLGFTPPETAPFKTATVETLAGAGTLAFNVDLTDLSGLKLPGETADHLAVTAGSAGALTVSVNPLGGEPTGDETAIPLITDPAGNATYRLEGGKLTHGLAEFEFANGTAADSTLPLDPRTWYLYSTGLSQAADAIIDTAALLAQDWHHSLDTLHLRMGEVRAENLRGAGPGGTGVPPAGLTGNIWMRTRGHRLNADNILTGRGVEQYAHGVTAGGDKAFETETGVNLLGAFIDMGRATRDFGRDSNGATNTIAIGAYATMLRRDGWHADLVLKADRHQHTFDVSTTNGRPVRGRYNNEAYGLSLEIGRRLERAGGWWIEPLAQAAVARLAKAAYRTTPANTAIDVAVAASTAAQYRAQVRFGRQLRDTRWTPYGKFGAAKTDTDGGEIHAHQRRLDPAALGLDGWRVEFGLGASYRLNATSQLHLDYEYAKAAHYERPWSLNLGYRRLW